MVDFHHNIFYYYRGAKISDHDREYQLENNTTKALINTLDNAGKTVQDHFLKWLGINPSGPINFLLQKKSIGNAKISRKPQRLLLGIENNRALTFNEYTKNNDSLPDAWIYGDNYVILIESKVVGSLEINQIKNHLHKLDIDIEGGLKRISWSEIHRFFTNLVASERLDLKSQWIIQQFKQYLEWNDMSDFVGFSEEMFDYFFTKDKETQTWVKDRMKAFAPKMLNELQKIDSFYASYDVCGNFKLKDDHCWVAFGPPDGEYRNYAHQTVSINQQGLEVFVNIELKEAISKLKKKIGNNKHRFIEHVSNLGDDLDFHVGKRIQKQVRLYDYFPVAKIKTRYLKDNELGPLGYEYIWKLLDNIPLPYVTIGCLIDKKDVLNLSKKDQGHSLINELAQKMKGFHSLVQFINGKQ